MSKDAFEQSKYRHLHTKISDIHLLVFKFGTDYLSLFN